jgi:hypothetical protein
MGYISKKSADIVEVGGWVGEAEHVLPSSGVRQSSACCSLEDDYSKNKSSIQPDCYTNNLICRKLRWAEKFSTEVLRWRADRLRTRIIKRETIVELID